MLLQKICLLSLLAYTLQASSFTRSITAESYYPAPKNRTQADAYVKQAFPFELSAPTTLTFYATYEQTPHTCIGETCGQDLNTFAFTQHGLYFDSDPARGVCNKGTHAPFPCSATLPAGNYDLVLEINDTTDTEDWTGNQVNPFTDTLSVTIDFAPEPSPVAIGLVGLGLVALRLRRISIFRRSRSIVTPKNGG
jgi:hypothetical protein